jgi:hypothetical protein
MKIYDSLLSQFFKTKKNFIRSDLNKLQLNGSIEKITTNCKKTINKKYLSLKESHEFDDTQRKNNTDIIFNPFGYKIQEILYKDNSKDMYDIKYFEYNSDLLIKTEKSFKKSNIHNYTCVFKYVYKRNSIEQLLYFGKKILYKYIYYLNNNKISLIRKIDYLPNNTEEKKLYFDENENIIKITDSYLQTQTINKFKNGMKIETVSSIEFDLVSFIAKYQYDDSNNCIEKSYHRENGEIFRTDSYKYDNYNNWVTKIINHTDDTIYKIDRKIEYRV